jgi:uncharacterized membrane protein YfcA
MTEILFLLLAYLAEIAGTLGGFGSSMLLVPLAGLFYDFKTVLGITALMHVFSNISKLILFRQGLNYRLLLLIGLPSVLMVIAGARISSFVRFEYAEFILGFFLLIFSLLMVFKPSFLLPDKPQYAISGGALAGFLAGMIGTGGAIRGLTLAAFNLEKNTFIATSAAIDFGVDFSRTLIYLYQDYMDFSMWPIFLSLVLVAYSGSYTGKILLSKFSAGTFRSVVLIIIAFTGLLQVIKFLT